MTEKRSFLTTLKRSLKEHLHIGDDDLQIYTSARERSSPKAQPPAVSDLDRQALKQLFAYSEKMKSDR